MQRELKEAQKTNRRLCITSAYITTSYDLDIYDSIDIKDENGILIDSISIETALLRFYRIPLVQTYGIYHAYIWNTEERKIERYITDLPDSEIKLIKKNRKIEKIRQQIENLCIELNNLIK